MKTTIEINVEEIAIDLASAGDAEQAIFLNKFFETLKNYYGNKYRYKEQLCSIERLLESHALEGLQDMVGE